MVGCGITLCLGGIDTLRHTTAEQELTQDMILTAVSPLLTVLNLTLHLVPPCVDQIHSFVEIDPFITSGLLVSKQASYEDMQHQRLTHHLILSGAYDDDGQDYWNDEDDDTNVLPGSSIAYQANLSVEHLQTLLFCCSILRPYLCFTYNVLALCVEGGSSVTELISSLKSRHRTGLFPYGEFCNEEPSTQKTVQKLLDYYYECEDESITNLLHDILLLI